MKVLTLPDYSKENLYQKALADSLSKFKVYVCFGRILRFLSLLKSAKTHWKPDIIHLHWLHPFFLASTPARTIIKSILFIFEVLILRILRIKIIWTVHNIVNHELKYTSIELFFYRLLTRLCNRIIAHSQHARKEILSKYKLSRAELVTTIPHGTYIDLYPNTLSRSTARRFLNFSENNLIFLYFGQIRAYKGILDLIDAFNNLDSFDTNLLIVGKPFDTKVAKQIRKKSLLSNNIVPILKFIPNDEIQVYMNTADIIVLPYRDVLTSGSVLLAMSFAKPVIAPALGSIPELLDNQSIFLYDTSKQDALLNAMRHALNADLKAMGEHNFREAEKLHWDLVAEKTYLVYSECLAT